ncbi:hypothetical protein [Gemmobacter serpentinus]|uniref:hypothetical protein n=1 Tax=Gemmobacter serpentinus TaxID=2652247 RepID=UPI00124DC4CE|nr:hypothetical protein [Gemmobacter serpentinus]
MSFAAQLRRAALWGGAAALIALALLALAEATGAAIWAALAVLPGLVAMVLLVGGVAFRAGQRWLYFRLSAPNAAYRRLNTASAAMRWLIWIDEDGRDRDASDPSD